jgi:CDP-glucose 4,6-dehydratase
LKWKGVWSNEKAFEKTVKWYKNFYENGEINTESDLREYISDAKAQNAEWAK